MAFLRYSTYLNQVQRQFRQDPQQALQSMVKTWETADRDEFRAAVLAVVPGGETDWQRFLLGFLLDHDDIVGFIGDHTKLNQHDATVLARTAQKLDPAFDVTLAMHLVTKAQVDEQDAHRILLVLDSISSPVNLLPMLANITRHPDAKVRSKAALMFGQGSQDADWVLSQFEERDGRVRANLVESLWGVDSESALEVFRRASQDRYQRAAVNGMIGLYLCGKVESVRLLFAAATNPNAAFRVSAAWAMGKTQDPRFVPVLARLVRDPNPEVRSSAMKAQTKIRGYRAMMERQPALIVRVGSAVVRRDGTREILGSVRAKCPAALASAIQYVAEEDGVPVSDYLFQTLATGETAMGIALPADSELDDGVRRAIDKAWRQLLVEKNREEPWAVTAFSNSERSRAAGTPPFTADGEELDVFRATQSRAPHSSFQLGLLALMEQLPELSVGGRRALLVVGSPAEETTQHAIGNQLVAQSVVQAARQSKVTVHAVAPPGCPSISRTALADLTSQTGGRYVEARDNESLTGLLINVAGGAFPNFQISYAGAGETPGRKLHLLVHAPQGIGECQMDLSTAVA